MPVASQQQTHPANKSLSVAIKTPDQYQPGDHLKSSKQNYVDVCDPKRIEGEYKAPAIKLQGKAEILKSESYMFSLFDNPSQDLTFFDYIDNLTIITVERSASTVPR
jgi:regulatory protein YycI of two-component signal transduction system YycFG